VLLRSEVQDVLAEFHEDPAKGGHGGRDYMLQAIGTLLFIFYFIHFIPIIYFLQFLYRNLLLLQKQACSHQ